MVDDGVLPDYSAVSTEEQPGNTAEAVSGEVFPQLAAESLSEAMSS